MAIPYQFYEGNFDKMGNIDPKAGNILICKDTRQVYIDLNLPDGTGGEIPTRICLGSIDINKSDGTKENIPLTDYVKSLLSDMENSDGTLKSVATFISEKIGDLGKKDDGTDKSVKDYVDENYVNQSGDTMTGPLVIDTSESTENARLELVSLESGAMTRLSKRTGGYTDLGTLLTDYIDNGVSDTSVSLKLKADTNTDDVSSAFVLEKRVGGIPKEYNILHTGNKNLIALEDLNGITITTTEVNYLDNVTSNIQTQIDGKAPTSHASTDTTYGASSSLNYGHAMASSTTPKANGTAEVGSETAKFARGDHVHPLQTSVSGNAGTATTLETARNIQIKLDSTSAASFDGSSNIEPGVTGTLSVANGGTGKTTLTSGYALVGNGTSAVSLRAITNNTATSSAITANTNLITANTLRYAINRTSSVAAADTNYTTLMARGMSLHAADTNPEVNGAITWTYE